MGGISRSSGGWGGTLDQRDPPPRLLHRAPFVPATTFLLHVSLLLLPPTRSLAHWPCHGLSCCFTELEKSPCACSQSVWLNRGALEMWLWKMAGSAVWRCVGSITGVYTSSGRSEWVSSAENFNYIYSVSLPKKMVTTAKNQDLFIVYISC